MEQGHAMSILLTSVVESEKYILQLKHQVSICYDHDCHLKVLVHFKSLLIHERSCILVKDIRREDCQFEHGENSILLRKALEVLSEEAI